MRKQLSLTVASVFYIGLIPGAPGTYASLAASLVFSLICYLSNWIRPELHVSAIGLISIVGVLSAEEVSRDEGIEDPSIVVIDEVAGQLVAFLFLPANVFNLIFGFVAFRVFDIWKPFPIRRLEAFRGGVGIMADDLLAGVYANLALQLISRLR
jgi:phosphatidylglycerophosphatase A